MDACHPAALQFGNVARRSSPSPVAAKTPASSVLDPAEDAAGVEGVGVLLEQEHFAVAAGVNPAVLVGIVVAVAGGGGQPLLDDGTIAVDDDRAHITLDRVEVHQLAGGAAGDHPEDCLAAPRPLDLRAGWGR